MGGDSDVSSSPVPELEDSPVSSIRAVDVSSPASDVEGGGEMSSVAEVSWISEVETGSVDSSVGEVEDGSSVTASEDDVGSLVSSVGPGETSPDSEVGAASVVSSAELDDEYCSASVVEPTSEVSSAAEVSCAPEVKPCSDDVVDSSDSLVFSASVDGNVWGVSEGVPAGV